MTGLNLVHSKYIIIREAAEFELTTRRFQRFALDRIVKNEKKNKFFQEYTDCTLVEQYLGRIRGAENSYRTRERFLQVDRSAGRSGGGDRSEGARWLFLHRRWNPAFLRSKQERANKRYITGLFGVGRCRPIKHWQTVRHSYPRSRRRWNGRDESGNTCRILERGGGAAVKKFMATKRQGVIIRVTPSTL